jgi:hypothetical protein
VTSSARSPHLLVVAYGVDSDFDDLGSKDPRGRVLGNNREVDRC